MNELIIDPKLEIYARNINTNGRMKIQKNEQPIRKLSMDNAGIFVTAISNTFLDFCIGNILH